MMSIYFSIIWLCIALGVNNIHNSAEGKQIQFGELHSAELEPILMKREEKATFIKIDESDQLNGTIRLIRETGFIWKNWNLARTMYYINYNLLADVDANADKINVSNVKIFFDATSVEYFPSAEWCKTYFNLPDLNGVITDGNDDKSVNNGQQSDIVSKQTLTHFYELSRWIDAAKKENNATSDGQLMSSEMLLVGHLNVFRSSYGEVLGCSLPILPTDLKYFQANLSPNNNDAQRQQSLPDDIVILNGSYIKFVEMPSSDNVRMLVQIVSLCNENKGTTMMLRWTQTDNCSNPTVCNSIGTSSSSATDENSDYGGGEFFSDLVLTTILVYNCSQQNLLKNGENINMTALCHQLVTSDVSTSKQASICVATGIQDFSRGDHSIAKKNITFWLWLEPNSPQMDTADGFEKRGKICQCQPVSYWMPPK